MSASAGLHAEQASTNARGEALQLNPRAILVNHNFAPRAEAYEVKYCLPQIDAHHTSLHGTPYLLLYTLQGIRRRSMPVIASE